MPILKLVVPQDNVHVDGIPLRNHTKLELQRGGQQPPESHFLSTSAIHSVISCSVEHECALAQASSSLFLIRNNFTVSFALYDFIFPNNLGNLKL